MRVSKKELEIYRELREEYGISIKGSEEIIREARVAPCMDALYFTKLSEQDKSIFRDILRNYTLPFRSKISEVFYL